MQVYGQCIVAYPTLRHTLQEQTLPRPDWKPPSQGSEMQRRSLPRTVGSDTFWPSLRTTYSWKKAALGNKKDGWERHRKRGARVIRRSPHSRRPLARQTCTGRSRRAEPGRDLPLPTQRVGAAVVQTLRCLGPEGKLSSGCRRQIPSSYFHRDHYNTVALPLYQCMYSCWCSCSAIIWLVPQTGWSSRAK